MDMLDRAKLYAERTGQDLSAALLAQVDGDEQKASMLRASIRRGLRSRRSLEDVTAALGCDVRLWFVDDHEVDALCQPTAGRVAEVVARMGVQVVVQEVAR